MYDQEFDEYIINYQEADEYLRRVEPSLKKDFKRYQKAQAELKNLAPKLVEVHKMLSDIYKIAPSYKHAAFRNLFIEHMYGDTLKGCNERVFFRKECLSYCPWNGSCKVVICSNGNLQLFVNLWGNFYYMSDVPDHITFLAFIKDSEEDMLSTLEKSVTVFQNFYTDAKKAISNYIKSL